MAKSAKQVLQATQQNTMRFTLRGTPLTDITIIIRPFLVPINLPPCLKQIRNSFEDRVENTATVYKDIKHFKTGAAPYALVEDIRPCSAEGPPKQALPPSKYSS